MKCELGNQLLSDYDLDYNCFFKSVTNFVIKIAVLKIGSNCLFMEETFHQNALSQTDPST